MNNRNTLNKPSYDIIFDLNDVIFSHHHEHRGTNKQFQIIKEGFEILHQCASQLDEYGRKRHRLFVLSNAGPDSHSLFVTHFPEIFSLFDGIVMSAHVGLEKPDTRFFQYLISRYQLNPMNCIFIDDKEVNVLAAQAIGMQGIICLDHAVVKQELKKLMIL